MFRSIFAIVILTAFVLGVTLTTKELATLNPSALADLTAPVLGKLGLSKEQTGEVAGEFIERFAQTGINKTPEINTLDSGNQLNKDKPLLDSPMDPASEDILTASDVRPLYQIALMADVHEDWDNFSKAISSAKDLDLDYIFYLGDFTDWGDIPSLEKGASILDESGIAWVALPGDHDLAQSASKNGGNGLENYLEVFESNYSLVTIGDLNFVLLDNSANFTELDEARFTWFLNNIGTADYLFLSQPIYHDQSKVLMGIVDGEENEGVANQRKIILNKVQTSGVKAVISADHHKSSVSVDPIRSSLKHIVVGAITSRRNLQTPRYTILNIFEDGTYNVEEVRI